MFGFWFLIMNTTTLKQVLWALIVLSLLPGLLLVSRRINAEGNRRVVTFVMDELALASQAQFYGRDVFELAQHYGSLGLNGIALYEETLSTLENKGDIYITDAAQERIAAIAAGEPLPELPEESLIATELTPGALDMAVAKAFPAPQRLEYAGRNWVVFEGNDSARPAGYRAEDMAQWQALGFDIAYRPRDYPNVVNVGQDLPAAASYLVYHGLQVAGHPKSLAAVVDASQDYITGIIEGTPQDGMNDIVRKVPTTRLLSFNQDYIDIRLSPADLIEKYLLSADERGIRIMYLRPYLQDIQGDMIDNTDAVITGLTRAFAAEGYEVARLPGLELNYQTSGLLRGLSSVGVLAGLGLLVLMYPGVWGVIVALCVLALGFLFGGFDWATLALVAAVTFPVIGYGHLSEKLSSLGLATLVSLMGAVLLSAVGSDRESILAITPFGGVAATLIIPPLLFAFHYALRYRRPAQWVLEFWNTPIRIGHIVLGAVGLLAFGLIFLRRGNLPLIGASDGELALRSWLSSLFVRPRFKELLGHPLAVLGLTGDTFPAWIKGVLLTGGVIAQGTIMNSFSHYHTPFLISLQRTLIALVLGLVIGLILTLTVRLGVRLARAWLGAARPQGVSYEAAD